MASSDTNDTATEDFSSCPSDDLADSGLLQIRGKERKPVPSGAVAKAYLDFTRDRARVRSQVSQISTNNHDLAPAMKGSKSASSTECSSFETSPTLRHRFEAVALETKEPQADHAILGLDNFDPIGTLQPTRFHALPPEVRALIFKEVLRVKEVELPLPAVEIPTYERVYPSFVNLSQQRRNDKMDSVLNLLEACRAFYYEAVPIFYEVNFLRVSTPAMLYGFLNDLPRSRRQYIRRLRIGGLGFHYYGWQLATKAFSMLSLCEKLEHLEIELTWDQATYNDIYCMGLWRQALEERYDLDDDREKDPNEAVIKEIQRSTACLQNLRGLTSIRFEMVGVGNPLISSNAGEESRDKMKNLATLWATKIRSMVTGQKDCE